MKKTLMTLTVPVMVLLAMGAQPVLAGKGCCGTKAEEKSAKCECCKCDPCTCQPCTCCKCDPCTCAKK